MKTLRMTIKYNNLRKLQYKNDEFQYPFKNSETPFILRTF